MSPVAFITVEFLADYAKSRDIVDSLNLKLEKYRYLLDPEMPGISKNSTSKKKDKKADLLIDNFDKYMNIEDSLGAIEFGKKIGAISKPKVIKSEIRGSK